ncbi:MAG: hypothetical protein AAB472_01775 [Patescibacteria group bacterium]
MTHLPPIKVGLVFGLFLALLHIAWSTLVALHLGQLLLNFSLRMHMIRPAFTVEPFDIGRALGLVIIAFCIGYIVGHVFAKIWNLVAHGS